jgi:hypothetical protein
MLKLNMPDGELSHEEGIRDDLAELFGVENDMVAGFVRLTAMKKGVANKQPCPCGSKMRLGKCHHNRINGLRKRAWTILVPIVVPTACRSRLEPADHDTINSHQIMKGGPRVNVLNLTVTVTNLEESNSWSGRAFFDDVAAAVNKTCGNLNVKSEVSHVLVPVILDADH